MKNILGKFVVAVLAIVMLLGITEPFAAYKKGEKLRVGVYDVAGYHSLDEEGNLVGFCADYLKIIAGITGWEYEFVEVEDFMDGLEALEEHEIDLISPAMITSERQNKFAYSELHFGMEYSILVTQKTRDDLFYQDYANYNGLKVAVLEGYPMTDYYIAKMQACEFETELIYVATQKEAEILLKSGEVDALATSVFYYDEAYKVLDLYYPQPFYFLTCKENMELLGDLNAAMNRIQENYPTLLEELLHSYYPVYEEEFYTREETKYIEKEKVLRVGYVSDRAPLSFTDEDGELAGISREIFDQIARISGLKFEYVEIPKGKMTYDRLQELELDLITGVEYNNVNMSSKGVLMSRPYVSGQKVLVSKSKSVYSEKENYKLALVGGSKTFRDVVTANYPNMEIVEYETVNDCFRALYNEDVDLLMQNQYVVETLMAKPMYSTFSVLPVEGIGDELCFSTITQLNGGYGLSQEECSVVISIINKAISQISKTEMDNLVMRSMVEYQYEMELIDFLYSYRYIIMICLCVVAAIMILYTVYRREKRRLRAIEEKEIRLKEFQQKRYKTIIECSDDLIYEISVNGEASMGSDKIKEKFGWEIPTGSQKIDLKRAMEILHIHPDDETLFRQSHLANTSGKMDDLTIRICKEDGTPVWCRLSRTILVDKNNEPMSILGKIVDIDREMRERQKLEKKSRTDFLTGLLNKQAFEKEVREYVDTHRMETASFIFIDMDHFKDINDKFGHSVGDQVIKETARKIQLLFKSFDVIGRFGGDEFCVFVKDMPRETLIDRLRFAVKKMEQEYTYEGGSVKLSASIGAAFCKHNTVSYKELMDVADAAAYQAKDNGRNCYIIKDVE